MERSRWWSVLVDPTISTLRARFTGSCLFTHTTVNRALMRQSGKPFLRHPRLKVMTFTHIHQSMGLPQHIPTPEQRNGFSISFLMLS